MKNVEIFDGIAKDYDRNTSIISFGIENWWRKKFVSMIPVSKPSTHLDIASATGEMFKLIEADKKIGIEPSKEMIKIAKQKFGDEVIFYEEYAESFQLNEKVDLVTIFMGVRNFDNIELGLKNIDNNIANGGILAIAELTAPADSGGVIYKLSSFYMDKIVPFIGGLLSGKFNEYKAFPETIKKIKDNDILNYLDNYEIIEHKRLFPPLASVIIARKNG